MTVLPIVVCGEPVLHAPARAVTSFDDELATLVSDMFDTTEEAPGVGLAAPQVGSPLSVFVWLYDGPEAPSVRGVAVNPTLWLSPPRPGLPGEDEEEGCLSFPGERFALRRSERALLRAQDLRGEHYELEATGWFARILQHEYDHLLGLLYVDRLLHPESRAASKARNRNGWGRPGVSWLPGRDRLEG